MWVREIGTNLILVSRDLVRVLAYCLGLDQVDHALRRVFFHPLLSLGWLLLGNLGLGICETTQVERRDFFKTFERLFRSLRFGF